MATIEVDFDVYKALTMRRASEAVTYNDVVRELLGLSNKTKAREVDPGEAVSWDYRGITFPGGTEFRARYKGKIYSARVRDGGFVLDGKRMNSPSEAAIKITGNNVNGWRFWECRFPGESRWRRLDSLR